jgi:membrane-bound serine protease (ClpP class)
MVLDAAIADGPDFTPSLCGGSSNGDLVGLTGKAVTGLFPSGQVEIEGSRYEARLEMGFAEAGTRVKVVGNKRMALTVEVVS